MSSKSLSTLRIANADKCSSVTVLVRATQFVLGIIFSLGAIIRQPAVRHPCLTTAGVAHAMAQNGEMVYSVLGGRMEFNGNRQFVVKSM